MIRSESGVKRELRRVKEAQRKKNLTEQSKRELYGSMQALEWVLVNNAMRPSKSGLITL